MNKQDMVFEFAKILLQKTDDCEFIVKQSVKLTDMILDQQIKRNNGVEFDLWFKGIIAQGQKYKITSRAYRTLRRLHVTSIDELLTVSEHKLNDIAGCGSTTKRDLMSVILQIRNKMAGDNNK